MILLDLFVTFFKIGLFTIGGGYAMIPMIQAEVTAKQWITVQDLVDFIAVSESTPGPFAVNIATYIGTESGGFLGAAVATLGVVLPSFLIILLVAKWFLSFKDNRFVQYALSGLRPTVVGLIAAAALSIALKNLAPAYDLSHPAAFLQSVNYVGVIVFVIILLLAFLPKNKPHPILLIGISAALGVVLCAARDLLLA